MKILIVDDSPIFLEVTQKWLKGEHETDIAHDGFEALSMMQDKKYDCAIIDLFMPEMSGIKLYSYIRKKYDIPILIMSNQIAADDLESLRHIEFRSLKPNTKKEFIDLLNKALHNDTKTRS